MAQTLTDRVKAIMNTPSTGELVSINELNDAFNKLDNHFVPAAKMLYAGTQSIPNLTTTVVDWDTVQYDSFASRSEGAMADIAANRFVCRFDGLYAICATIQWANNATGYRAIRLLKNGTTFKTQFEGTVAAAPTSCTVYEELDLVSGDIITFSAIQASGGALDITRYSFTDDVSASMRWIGSLTEV